MGSTLLKDKNKLFVAYKILNDSLFLILLFFVLAVLAESFLPGLITFHFRFYKIVLLLAANLIGLYYVSYLIQEKSTTLENLERAKPNKKTLLALLLVSFIILANTFFRLNILVSLVLVASIYAIGYFLYRVLFEE